MRRFPRKWQLAIAALLAQPTVATAAVAAGVSKRTIERWLQTPVFAEEFQRCCKAVLDESCSRLAGATGMALEALTRNLTAESPGDQIRAASQILTLAFRAAEMQDLAERMQALEKHFAAASSKNGNGYHNGTRRR